jgi:hypothetical protein
VGLDWNEHAVAVRVPLQIDAVVRRFLERVAPPALLAGAAREDSCTRTVAFLLRGFRMKAAPDADRHPVPSEAGSGLFLLRPTTKAYKNCNKGTSLLQLRKRSDQMRNSSPRRWRTVWSSRSA